MMTIQQFAKLGAAARWRGMTPEQRKAATAKATAARKKQAKEAKKAVSGK